MTSSSAQPAIIVFTSPKAGSGVGRDQIDKLAGALSADGYQFAVTDKVSRLDQWLRDQDPHQDSTGAPGRCPKVVVSAGGDGTVGLAASRIAGTANEIVSPTSLGAGSTESSRPTVCLLPMPMGTENLLARHFGYRCDADQVMETLRRDQPFELDMGLIGSKPFLCMTTCGFDAEVVRSMHLTRRGHIRKIDYAGPVFRALRRYPFPSIRIESADVDSGQLECGWAMVFNLPCYAAALQIQPDAISDDGLLDVVAFRGRSVIDAFRYVLGVYRGRHFNFRDVVRFQTRQLRISASRRVPFQIDGDYGGRLPIDIRIAQRAVSFLRPAE